MRTDTLNILSEDTDHLKKTRTHRYLVNTTSIKGYDLDEFAKSNASNTSPRTFLKGDTHSTADALVDNSLLSSCNYLNFIEFKAGRLDLARDFQKIRRKATESLLIYAYWKNIPYFSIPIDIQFLLVYNDYSNGNCGRNNRQYARANELAAQSIVQQLQANFIINDLYRGNISCCSGKAFDADPMNYIK